MSTASTKHPSPTTRADRGAVPNAPGAGPQPLASCAQQRDLLNTNYFHVVFTVPHELNPLALTSPRPFFDLLFEASSQTLLEAAADPRRLGAEIGFLSGPAYVEFQPAGPLASCPLQSSPAGGLSADHRRCLIHTSHPLFLLLFPYCAPCSATKVLDGLRQLHHKNQLDCRGPQPISVILRSRIAAARLGKKKWFVYAKPPFGGPAHVLRLSRSLHPPHGHIQPIASWPSTDRRSPSSGGVTPTAASSAS